LKEEVEKLNGEIKLSETVVSIEQNEDGVLVGVKGGVNY